MSATSTPAGTSDASRARIDPRGPRFAATLTTVLLALVLLSAPSPVGLALLAAQTLFFAVGAVAGVQHTPYAWLFKDLVRPRLGPPADLEDAAPPRFAQTVGLAFAVVGLVGYATGLTLLGSIAIGLAPGRRVPQRGVRVLPRVRDVPAGAPARARQPYPERQQPRRAEPGRSRKVNAT
jgi:hypothetical protein